MPAIDWSWGEGPRRPRLDADVIDVWRLDLRGDVATYAADLAPAELERLPGFHRASVALQYAASRALVRRILGGYLDLPPRRVSFVRSRTGKPRVLLPASATHLEYNVTHSYELGLLAVGQQELGVDIERIRPAPMAAGVAAGIVAEDGPIRPSEVDSAERDWQFFRIWTRTEAALKAIGEGLSAIDRRPASWIRSLSAPDARGPDGRSLLVVDLPVDLEYAAALAVVGGERVAAIRCWTAGDVVAARSGGARG